MKENIVFSDLFCKFTSSVAEYVMSRAVGLQAKQLLSNWICLLVCAEDLTIGNSFMVSLRFPSTCAHACMPVLTAHTGMGKKFNALTSRSP